MSKPTAADNVMSRLRRPAGRFRDTPIWAKLGLIMIVPTIATVVVGTNGLIGHIQTQTTAERARDLAGLSQTAGQLVHDLQNERAAATMLLAPRAGASAAARSNYTATHQAVEAAKRPYSQQRNAIAELPENIASVLKQIDSQLTGLPGVRSKVINGSFALSEAESDYQALLSYLLTIRDSAARLAGNNELSDRMRAAAEVSRIKDNVAQRRVVVHQILGQGDITAQLREQYIATKTGERQALDTFRAVASRAERDSYDKTVAGAAQGQAAKYQSYLDGNTTGSVAGAPFDAAQWDAAMRAQADLLRAVERELDGRMVTLATRLRDDVQQRLLLETGLLLGMLLLAVLFAWLVARSMARSLRELRHGALAVAQHGLPHAVARLRDPALAAGHLTPAQVADQIAEPLPVRTRDEFGQVTEAFNAVHLEAVRTAAEQAALRSSVATMFVNLARRSQILVDRLIGHLDRLERGEEDPDALAELFQLDHLATRMRRNDENLLVLAGADSTRVQREPAALIDVLRAAQSEVEHYTRIEFGIVDRDIEVAAHAVNDLVHLVAELFDNATAFSPPDSHIVVEARRVGDRAVLYVEDRGIGISPDQLLDLNERLASPPQVDVAVSRMMGLVVVARLAARHGVRVELRPAAERGTIADVTLPPAVLVPRSLSGRPQPAVSAPAYLTQSADAGPGSSSRSPFSPPMALEGGGPSSAPPAEPYAPLLPDQPRPYDPAPQRGNGAGNGLPGRPMPAWSDLTGAAPNGAGTPHTNGAGGLPQRRPDEAWPADAQPWRTSGDTDGRGSTPSIPRQTSAPPDPRAFGGGPAVVPPGSAPPVVSAPPVGSAPPVFAAPPAGS
ncbi:MAG TPA: nitrate- and nitrite sensing domain-containing protein, partial [Pilimelia sp.]|nr:nitrate- and nitrite sensing domain-containing protein [Pilimelia sp.]